MKKREKDKKVARSLANRALSEVERYVVRGSHIGLIAYMIQIGLRLRLLELQGMNALCAFFGGKDKICVVSNLYLLKGRLAQ